MNRRTAALSLLLLAGCADRPQPTAPASRALATSTPTAARSVDDRLFSQYVAMGSSIAAGFMSAGISSATQTLAYPALLAEGMKARFRIPLLALPGCPAPWIAPLTPDPTAPPCAGRADHTPLAQLNTVAVPGMTVGEALLPGTANLLQALMIDGVSQVEAMQRANPTFVTVHLGDNDAFRAALAGVLPGQLTPLADFAAAYAQVVAAVAAEPRLQGAALVGVTDPVLGAPILQPGAYFFLSRDASGRFQGKPVNANCSPVTPLGTPNPLAATLVSFAIVRDAAFAEINCDPAAYPIGDPRRGAYLLDLAEQATIRERVAQFNAVIAAEAASRGWAYVDPNAIVIAGLASRTAGRANAIRKCQDLATATTAAQFQLAVLNTCPVTGPTAAPNFFGSLISFDGVHPSAEGQAALALAVGSAIDARYGTSLVTP